MENPKKKRNRKFHTHTRDEWSKWCRFPNWTFERFLTFFLFWNIEKNLLETSPGRQNEQLRTWEILRTTLWVVGEINLYPWLQNQSYFSPENFICYLLRKFSLLTFEKIFFATVKKIFFATVEKLFFATFWVGFWAYLRRASPCCIFHRTFTFRRLRLGPSGCFILHPVFLL